MISPPSYSLKKTGVPELEAISLAAAGESMHSLIDRMVEEVPRKLVELSREVKRIVGINLDSGAIAGRCLQGILLHVEGT